MEILNLKALSFILKYVNFYFYICSKMYFSLNEKVKNELLSQSSPAIHILNFIWILSQLSYYLM